MRDEGSRRSLHEAIASKRLGEKEPLLEYIGVRQDTGRKKAPG